MRGKRLSDLTFSGIVSESPCALCWADRIPASYLLGSTSSSSGIEESLRWPQFSPRTNLLVLGRDLEVSGLFNTLSPLPLTPCPQPTLHSTRTKRYFIAMSLLHYWSKLARLSPLGEGKKTKRPKSISPHLPPTPPPQLHSNV